MALGLKSLVDLGAKPVAPTPQQRQERIGSALWVLFAYAEQHQMTPPELQDVCINLQLEVFNRMRMLLSRAL